MHVLCLFELIDCCHGCEDYICSDYTCSDYTCSDESLRYLSMNHLYLTLTHHCNLESLAGRLTGLTAGRLTGLAELTY